MSDAELRARLDHAIEQLDDAQRQRLIDRAGSINTTVPRSREPGASIGPLPEQLHIRNDGATEDHALYRLDVQPDLPNRHGVLHGGPVFVMVDYSMGGASMSVLPPGDICATTEIEISYLARVRGGTLTADAHIIKQGRRVVYIESKATNDGERLAAAVTGSFAVVPASERG